MNDLDKPCCPLYKSLLVICPYSWSTQQSYEKCSDALIRVCTKDSSGLPNIILSSVKIKWRILNFLRFWWYLNGRCLPPLLPSFEKPTETPVNLDYRSNAFHYPNNECIVESHAIKTSLKLIFNPLTDPSSQCNQAWCFSLTTSAHHIIHMTLSFCWGTLTTIYRFWHNLTDSKA